MLRTQKIWQDVDHWNVSDDQWLLFDRGDSKLPVLDLTDKQLMEDIYKDNDSGWIKIGVVRDPVTRFLSAYLDLVHTWPTGSEEGPPDDHGPKRPRRGLETGDNWDWFDAIRRHRRMKEEEAEQERPEKAGGHQRQKTRGGDGEEEGWPTTRDDGPRHMRDAYVPNVPTFEELLDLLTPHIWAAPSAFRPTASLCGMWQSPFDAIIPFEKLKVCKQHLQPGQTRPNANHFWQVLNTFLLLVCMFTCAIVHAPAASIVHVQGLFFPCVR